MLTSVVSEQIAVSSTERGVLERVRSLPVLALALLSAIGMSLFGGCATLQSRESPQVFVVGIEPLPSGGLELRMLVKLRIQNPNEQPLDYAGLSFQMDVQGKRVGAGVSDAKGSVPPFGETIIDVPVSISVLQLARQAIDVVTDEHSGTLKYKIKGKLAQSGFGSTHFTSTGELELSEVSKNGTML
jgi:LEA14-like dessication related protein